MFWPEKRQVHVALAWGVASLKLARVADPARDARLLMAHALGIPRDRLTLEARRAIAPAEEAAFNAAVAERARGRPVSKIVGHRAFWGRDFIVTDDVLDPRPETESLVALALEAPFSRVLDLGTGSGAILLSLLGERSGATGLGTDVSDAALDVARANAAAFGLSERAAFRRADWLSGLDGGFDLVVSNPPYIAASEIAGLDREVRDFDPPAALTDGGDGLGAYRAIAAGADGVLVPGGRLLVEIGWTQGAAVSALFRGAGLADVAVHPDLDGRDRIVAARRK